ncbi:O-methyl transferase family protein [Pseudomonas aeruginosa]|nr:O-methyl transferase family protein [Pseudomonas aeruginosa]
MALMFPRLARNFAKNGYYPTDEPTLERALKRTDAQRRADVHPRSLRR